MRLFEKNFEQTGFWCCHGMGLNRPIAMVEAGGDGVDQLAVISQSISISPVFLSDLILFFAFGWRYNLLTREWGGIFEEADL